MEILLGIAVWATIITLIIMCIHDSLNNKDNE